MTWQNFHSAPHDRLVWLFLPSASYKSDAQGRPTEVTHAAVVGKWTERGWVNTLGATVYPSLWHDADVTREAPDIPSLA